MSMIESPFQYYVIAWALCALNNSLVYFIWRIVPMLAASNTPDFKRFTIQTLQYVALRGAHAVLEQYY